MYIIGNVERVLYPIYKNKINNKRIVVDKERKHIIKKYKKNSCKTKKGVKKNRSYKKTRLFVIWERFFFYENKK